MNGAISKCHLKRKQSNPQSFITIQTGWKIVHEGIDAGVYKKKSD